MRWHCRTWSRAAGKPSRSPWETLTTFSPMPKVACPDAMRFSSGSMWKCRGRRLQLTGEYFHTKARDLPVPIFPYGLPTKVVTLWAPSDALKRALLTVMALWEARLSAADVTHGVMLQGTTPET
jgi:hypothetical protein